MAFVPRNFRSLAEIKQERLDRNGRCPVVVAVAFDIEVCGNPLPCVKHSKIETIETVD